MMILNMVNDCINHMETFLDIHGYIQWKNTCHFIKNNIIDMDKLDIYHGEWNKKGDKYYGSIKKGDNRYINHDNIRDGFGIYTTYCYNNITKTIGYWKNNQIKNRKIIKYNTKKGTEQWRVKHKYNLKIHDTIPQEKTYYGEWKNFMRNGIGMLESTCICNNNKSNGYWIDNKKHRCHNEIYFKYDKNDQLWNRTCIYIYVKYYNMDKELPFSLKIDDKKVFIINSVKKETIAFGVGNYFPVYTVCNNITNIVSTYLERITDRIIKPLCIIDMACSKNKLCNCELCNHIIKNEKYYRSLVYTGS